MKFTKEDAVKDLDAKFKVKDKDLDLSRTINEIVDNTLTLVGNDENMELSTFVGVAEKMISSSVGFMRHEVSVAVKSKDDEIVNLKSQINPNPHTPPTPPEQNAELKAMQDRLKVLEDAQNAREKAKRISDKRSELITKIKDGGVKNDEWIEAMLGKANITEELDVETEAKSYVEMFNKFSADYNPHATPRSTGGNAKTGTEKVLEEVKNLRKATIYNPPTNN